MLTDLTLDILLTKKVASCIKKQLCFGQLILESGMLVIKTDFFLSIQFAISYWFFILLYYRVKKRKIKYLSFFLLFLTFKS